MAVVFFRGVGIVGEREGPKQTVQKQVADDDEVGMREVSVAQGSETREPAQQPEGDARIEEKSKENALSAISMS